MNAIYWTLFGIIAAVMLFFIAKHMGYINLTKGDRSDKVDDDAKSLLKKVEDDFGKSK